MEKGRDIKKPHASLSLSRAESVSRCWSLVDIHTHTQNDANSECATRLQDTCLHSVVLGHVSVEPHAMRFHVDQRVKVEELLTHPEWVSRVPSAFVTEFL